MIDWFHTYFPVGRNYLVCQNNREQINSNLWERLVFPLQSRHKHNLWGEFAKELPLIAKKIGWVPNKIPATFLCESVEYEIADACAAQENYFQSNDEHLLIARKILKQLKLIELADRNPFFLSEGETKLIWFLTQWVKQPEYLIIGHLPSCLSKSRINNLLDFIDEQKNNLEYHPTIILGYVVHSQDWCASLFNHEKWKVISNWPEL